MPHCGLTHVPGGDIDGPHGGITVHSSDFEAGAIYEDLTTSELRPQVYFEAPLADAALLRRAAAWLEAVL